jgi:hypothetical protein
MQTTLKVLSLGMKVLGVVMMLDWTSLAPKWGMVVFAAASITKDTINRIGDWLDDQKANNSFK